MGIIAFGKKGRQGGVQPQQGRPQLAGALLGFGDAAASPLDAEEFELCPLCGLPLGEFGYAISQELFHGECAAELALHRAQEDEELRQEKELKAKKACRRQYGIGWKPEHIPSSAELAREFGCDQLQQGGALCCLILQEPEHLVQVAVTQDPGAAVNLEYLSLALQIRRHEGREPLFSLDPKFTTEDDPAAERWQVKRFEPEWLASTSAGEVMCQADLYLKELSMGEYEQPVAGMRSCLDMDEIGSEAWHGREWFVVRSAQILITDENTLVPVVDMAVEAREQIRGVDGLEDAVITRPEHPLVRFAEAFTTNFDLIAERRSVIYHLRELAKASLLAKFLLEANFEMDGRWFSQTNMSSSLLTAAEIPQLWNKRHYSQIRLDAGHLVDAAGPPVQVHGVYGGVQFGLERLELATELTTGISVRAGPLSAAAQIKQPGIIPFRRARAAGAAPRRLLPRGVDLSLDSCSMPHEPKATPKVTKGSWACVASSAAAASTLLGDSFWQHLAGGSSPMLSESDANFLRELFHPRMSDRREDGGLFIPPDPSEEYVAKLRGLLHSEREFQRRRREHFLSADFMPEAPGDLFPRSWTSRIGIRSGLPGVVMEPNAEKKAGCLKPRPDYHVEAKRFQQMLQNVTPIFDKCTEDGVHHRIYHLGSLEIRTLQEEADGEESLAAFFVRSAPPPLRSSAATPSEPGAVGSGEKVVRVVQYVEPRGREDAAQRPLRNTSSPFHYYIVLETECGNFLVGERRRNQSPIWVGNPPELEARSCVAKVMQSIDCQEAKLTVGDLRERDLGCEARQFAEEISACALAACEEGAAWGDFTDGQREAARRLGIRKAAEWFDCSAQVFRVPWKDLTQTERTAACFLGFDKDAWSEAAAWRQSSAAGAI